MQDTSADNMWKFLGLALRNIWIGFFSLWGLAGLVALYYRSHFSLTIDPNILFFGSAVLTLFLLLLYVLWYGISRDRRIKYIAAFDKTNFGTQDNNAWKIFSHQPTLLLFLLGGTAITPIVGYSAFIVPYLAGTLSFATSLILGFVLATLIWCITFLLVAELYQRNTSPNYPHSIILTVLSNTMKALPYILLLSVTWWLLLLTRKRRNPAEISTPLPLMSLAALKVFVLINLAHIALHDSGRWSLKESLGYVREHGRGILKMWFFSGGSVIYIAVPIFMAFGWASVIDFSFGINVILLALPLLFLIFVLCLEQMNTILYMDLKKQ